MIYIEVGMISFYWTRNGGILRKIHHIGGPVIIDDYQAWYNNGKSHFYEKIKNL